MFPLDQGPINGTMQTHSSLSDGIADALPASHTQEERLYAVADAIERRLEGYSSYRFLVKFWLSQSGPVAEIAEHDPALFSNLVNCFAAKVEELA